MMRPTLTRALIATVVATAVPAAAIVGATPAQAQPKPADKKKVAKEYTDAGLAAQNAGDYPTALQFYAKAYELVPHPLLLFNVAQTHRLAGDLQPAIDAYQQYLAADPSGAKAKLAREFITALEIQRAAEVQKQAEAAKAAEAARAAEEARLAEEARQAEEARKAEEARQAEEARRHSEVDRPIDPQPPVDRPAPRRGGGLRLVGLASAGVGVAAVGVGLGYFGRKAASLSDELSQPGVMFDQQKYDDGEAANRNAIIASAAGGALIVAGVVMYVVGRKQGASAERVSLVPSIAPGHAALVLTGSLP